MLDILKFKTALASAAAAAGRADPAIAQVKAMHTLLTEGGYATEEVLHGIAEHCRDPGAGMYPVTVAHIIGHIKARREKASGHLPTELAWVCCKDIANTMSAYLAQINRNPHAPVGRIWNGSQALDCFVAPTAVLLALDACASVFVGSDEFGRRKSFFAAYEHIVAQARQQGQQETYTPRIGKHANAEDVRAVLLGAVAQGLIAANHPDLLRLPAPSPPSEKDADRDTGDAEPIAAFWKVLDGAQDDWGDDLPV